MYYTCSSLSSFRSKPFYFCLSSVFYSILHGSYPQFLDVTLTEALFLPKSDLGFVFCMDFGAEALLLKSDVGHVV
ncbi:hypothetical protein CIPAW_04G127300 [Carya illinoinensis]|uniref:Uncharacterized protein n=1 Tax=Carya illinoinensis TaxID=32201 RepID=A0A8T1QVI0_CARIL|nr:hypothetical protein CIPAW_04G127300 [Carya illinoinensis]